MAIISLNVNAWNKSSRVFRLDNWNKGENKGEKPNRQQKTSQSLAALGGYLVDDTGLEPVTPCTSRNLPKISSNLCAAVDCSFWFLGFCNIFCKWSHESVGIYRTKPLFMTRQPCDTAPLYFSQIRETLIRIKKFLFYLSKNYCISKSFLAYSTL